MPRQLRQPQFVRISLNETSAPGYSTSLDRLRYLTRIAELGESAKTLKEFTESFLDDEETILLELMKKPDADLKTIHSNYMAAVRLANKVLSTIEFAESKKDSLEALQNKIKGVNKK